MPYIKQEDRERLKISNDPRTEGELNYLLTLEYIKFIKENGESYSNYGFMRTEIQLLVSHFSNMETGIMRIGGADFFKNDFIRNLDKIIDNFFTVNYLKGLSQEELNEHFSKIRKMVIGALINSSEELYRRKISVYEDKKIAENGDVY